MSVRLKVGFVVVVTLGLAALWWSVASAHSGGSDGGDTVSVGVSTSSSSPGSSGGQPSGRSGHGHKPGGVKNPCVDMALGPAETAANGIGGPTPGGWYLVICGPDYTLPNDGHLEWLSTAKPTPSAAATGSVDAKAVAAQAAASIKLPVPSLHLNPATFSVVNLPSWLAVDPSIWHSYTASATAGGVTAQALAVPETVTWSMGDGGVETCSGPGQLYDPNLLASQQSSSCTYTYKRPSVGQASSDGNPNDGAFSVTATVTWKVTWTAIGEPGGGDLPDLHTSSQAAVRVEQVESVGVAP